MNATVVQQVMIAVLILTVWPLIKFLQKLNLIHFLGDSKEKNEIKMAIDNLESSYLATLMTTTTTTTTTSSTTTTPSYTHIIKLSPSAKISNEDNRFDSKGLTTTFSLDLSNFMIILIFTFSVCLVNGVIYQIGDLIPSDETCSNCYCSLGGIKKCKKIQCSPVMEGCRPIVPEGHCCPVEYKCSKLSQATN